MLAAYGAAGRLAAPGLRLMLRRRAAAGKELPARLAERFGIASLPRPTGRLIWVHAASVGETMSVLPVIAALRGQAEVLLTTGTVTSAALAAARLPDFARHQFVPLDVQPWVRRFYNYWRPDAVVFVESEIWPGLLAAADTRDIPRLLINARLSEASAARWRRLPGLARRLFGGFAEVHARSAADAARLTALGAAEVKAWGDLKFAAETLPADPKALAALRALLPAPVWLAASTHEGEEEIVLAAHRALAAAVPGLITVIVPRHPARGDAVAALAPVARRSRDEMPVAGDVYLADTLGELGLFYRAAPFAFLGKSLAFEGGGHNVLEPARLGVPVIVGPHTQNFAEAVRRLREAGGLQEVADAAGLVVAVRAWLADPAAARAAGAAAQAATQGDDDLPARLAVLILESL